MPKIFSLQFFFTFLIAVIIFTLAIYCFPFLYQYFIPKSAGVIYNITQFETPFNQAKLFAFICAAVPFLCLLLFRLVPVSGIKKQAVAAAIIIVSMLTAVFIRRYILQQDLTALTHTPGNFNINTSITTVFDHINFEYWLAVGMLSGAFISFAFFKKSKKRWTGL